MRVLLAFVPLIAALACNSSGAELGAAMNAVDAFQLREEAVRLERQGMNAEAEGAFRRLAEYNPDDGKLWLGLGRTARGAGHPRQAIEAFTTALNLGFGFEHLLCLEIAKLQALSGERELAYDWIEKALAARFDNRAKLLDVEVFAAYRDDPRFRRLAGMLPEREFSREEGWRYDIDYYAQEAKRLHFNPDGPRVPPEFESAALALKSNVPELTNNQIAAELQRMAVLLGTGHSSIYPIPTPVVQLSMLPIDLYLFSDGLVIVGGTGEAEKWVGYTIERFGKMPTAEVLEKAGAFVTKDNPMGVKWMGPLILTIPAMLDRIGVTAGPSEVELTLAGPDGETEVIELRGENFRMPQPLMGSAGVLPLYFQNRDKNYWMKSLPEYSAQYVQYNQVENAPDDSIRAFSARLTDALRIGKARNVIVDVRWNNGGNSFLNAPLVQALIRHESASPEHRIFVLAGRNTFSAAQNFVTAVDAATDAIFAGEPTGSRPNHVGEDTEFSLPYSGLMVSISSRYFQDSTPGDNRIWIPARIPVAFSSEDYFANRDPVMEAVLEVIEALRGPA